MSVEALAPTAIPPEVWAELKKQAKRACDHAYCDYSHFPVGAAVLTDTEQIFAGCNVENASYGLTICAERNAVFQAVAHAERLQPDKPPRIKAVVVYTPNARPASPCGACRQVINEFGPEAEVRSICEGLDLCHARLSELLPAAFGPNNL